MAPEFRLIVNPASGGGRCGRALPGVVERLKGHELDFRTTFTRSLEHAQELGGEAMAAGATPVAVGGDGLISSVINGVKAVGGSGPMGIVPAGTGNDFARWLGVHSIDDGVANLVSGHQRQVDLGMINGRYFTSIASFGFDSDVITLAQSTRRIKGAAVYHYATLKSLTKWKPANFHITVDGVETKFSGYSVVVANGGSYGGGMRIAPGADLEDGLFDVVTIGEVGKAKFLMQAPKVFSGKHVDNPEVSVQRGSVVKLEADRAFTIFADGESCAPAPATVTIQPQAISILSPAAPSLPKPG